MRDPKLTLALEGFVFRFRGLLLLLLALVTAFMAYMATQTYVDAGFRKQLPLEHPYMDVYLESEQEFGSANQVLVALMAKEGTILTPEFFETLERVTDEVFFIPGVERGQVRSLFTPNVRYTEVVEDGLVGGNVIPADFQPTEAMFQTVRENIIKSGEIGRLVTDDFDGAMIQAPLLDRHPETGEPLDYVRVSDDLERIRAQFETENIDIHIIGFPMMVGDVVDAVGNVVLFFAVALLVTALLLLGYSGSLKLTVLPLTTSIVAVIWQLGLLNILGYGIDPMNTLVPFLVFAIAVSHGVQMINAWIHDILNAGATGLDAARGAFRRLLVPGTIALVSDTLGFFVIQLIDIRIIQETALAASVGVAVIIITNLLLLPILLSYTRMRNPAQYRERQQARLHRGDRAWNRLARMTERGPATAGVVVALVLLGLGLWQAQKVHIGDLQAGVPELRQDSEYNRDARAIVSNFAIGIDVMSVFARTVQDGCTQYPIMDDIDRFSWAMENVEGVQSVNSLPYAAREINAGYNEGNPKWRILPSNQYLLVQSVYPVETSTGLLNDDCSVMPVYVFTRDHRASTINRVVERAERYAREESGSEDVEFALAGGNVGVMAATNQAIEAAQVPMLVYVYAAVILLVLITFRSVRGMLCVILPLGLLSVLAYALMALLGIGLKVSTLPVAALGVGIGVDYGIYIYTQFDRALRDGRGLRDAYLYALQTTGRAVMFTGLTLAIGVATWIFSALKFQADMGLMLTFLFLANMVGAVFLLPALAHFLINPAKWAESPPERTGETTASGAAGG